MELIMRLGLDIGSNSIGWWLYQTNQNKEVVGHIGGGSRIFSDGRDPKSKASLAVSRRDARSARRRRDRYLRRRAVLIDKLAAAGLMPNSPDDRKALEGLDPFALRARGLSEQMELSELGRALFHINQRRGFKSNRKTDGKDNEGGKIKDGAARLDQAILAAGAKTYGEFLHKRRMAAQDERAIPSVRTRLGMVQSDDKQVSGYDFYPTRALFEEEFIKLWTAQAAFYPKVLTDGLRNEIWQVIFYQRPLKEPKIGLCFFEDEQRMAKAHPLFQERRLYETVNALRVVEDGLEARRLTLDQRDILILAARDKKKVTFATLRKALKLRRDQRFSLERGNRKDIEGDEVRTSMKKAYGANWTALSIEDQWAIIQAVRNAEDTDELLDQLRNEFGMNEDQAHAVAKVNLPDGYGRLSEIATRKILEKLKADVVLYSDAASEVYGFHSDDRTGEVLEMLPYYGELLQRHVIPGSHDAKQHDPVRDAAEYWGRITNPTVHIGLNQLRRLVNDIIRIYGMPDQIVVELARDLKNSEKEKKKINAEIRKLTDAAIMRGEKIEELGLKNTGEARMRMRLWDDSHLDATKRCCPYCGEIIGVASLFDGSTDVDHILPYSRTLDDSISNKVLCHQSCNRDKRNRSPYEAWGHIPEKWDSITTNLKNLPHNKAWRFAPDAMERFEGEAGFLARQLTDTQYLSRIAREYLSWLYPDPKTAPVWVVPGKLTEMLRRKWALNEFLSDSEHQRTAKKKNRQDHRHHAIDAAVIAATDRGLLQRISRASARSAEMGKKEKANIELPWDGFRAEMKTVLDGITASHKPDHGTVGKGSIGASSGQLHNDTAYGLTGKKSDSGANIVVTRKPLDSLGPKDIAKIRDENLRDKLWDTTRDLSGKEFTGALLAFSQNDATYRGIRRVRLIDAVNVIPIMDKTGKAYKGYKGDSNHCVEVWRLPDGKWKAEILSTFDANQKGLGASRPHPAAKLMMRLFKKDAVALDHPKHGEIQAVIAKFSANGLNLYTMNEANVDARDRDKSDPFKYLFVGSGTLQKYKFRKIGIDTLGRITDPGPMKS
jgi:CRISPR-associated endonuclease Csn1